MATEEYEECVLRAKMDNVKNISQLLKCIHFKERSVCFASKNGLKFVVEDSKCVQAAAFIGVDMFQEYEIEEELVGFKLELNVLMECLNILDGAAHMKLYYKGHGFPLRIIIVEDDVITDCSIKTLEAVEISHFSLPSDEVVNKIIMDGPNFKEVLSDLYADSEFVQFRISQGPPYFVATTHSTAGKCEISITKDADMVEEFDCSSTTLMKYKYSQIKPALKILQAAAKVSFQVGKDGLLCIQFMIRSENNQLAYIEYFCLPILSDDEMDE